MLLSVLFFILFLSMPLVIWSYGTARLYETSCLKGFFKGTGVCMTCLVLLFSGCGTQRNIRDIQKDIEKIQEDLHAVSDNTKGIENQTERIADVLEQLTHLWIECIEQERTTCQQIANIMDSLEQMFVNPNTGESRDGFNEPLGTECGDFSPDLCDPDRIGDTPLFSDR